VDNDDSRRGIAEALAQAAAQQPAWPDLDRVRSACESLARAAPLVAPGQVDELTQDLAAVARGEALLLQGGDCAETFAQNTEPHVRGNIETLLKMAAVLTETTGMPVIRMARIAGQFAKPRSSDRDPFGLPAYRGDIINSAFPAPLAREPAPERMTEAYRHSQAALDTVQAMSGQSEAARVFISHELLLLDYERALLRNYERGGRHRIYSTSAHFLWVGERTRQVDGAHVALARLLANPVGLKIGPAITADEAVNYVRMLNPADTPGRLTLICRLGSGNVRRVLPPIVEKVTAAGYHPVWLCDPMHGNTFESPSGYKTRQVEQIGDEIREFIKVHRELGTHPGGIHIEMTGDDVTECLGGRKGLSDVDLAARYETACDPRLNGGQALEIAELAACSYSAP
jgi:3-deoxy-D-arabino-heptulosonate 7-phosphate (DAHP) synthase class II